MTASPKKSPSLQKFRCWLQQSERVSARWLGWPCITAAWLGLSLAVISPTHGSGIKLCWFESTTGIPCPGCGMTRSLSCGIRGMFAESWHYHPLGLFVLGLFILTAAQSLFPNAQRARLAVFMQARAVWFNGFYLSFVIAFVTFGLVRALVHLAQGWTTFR